MPTITHEQWREASRKIATLDEYNNDIDRRLLSVAVPNGQDLNIFDLGAFPDPMDCTFTRVDFVRDNPLKPWRFEGRIS